MNAIHRIIAPLALAILLSAVTVQAQTQEPKIGIVYTSPHPVINQIIQGFEDVVKTKYPNAKFIKKHANSRAEEYGTIVLSAIQDSLNLLVPITTPITIQAVEQSRGIVPVVFMGVTDPVGAKVVNSLNQPGLSSGSCDLCPFESLLQLTKEIFPDAKVIGLPYNPQDQPAVFGRQMLIDVAGKYGFKVVDQQVTSASELPIVVKSIAEKSDVVIIAADNLMMENPALISEAALNAGKPTIACDQASVERGAVAGIGVNYTMVGNEGGNIALRVLAGEKPGEIPVSVLSKGDVAVNLKAACAANVSIGEGIVNKASEVYNRDFVCETAKPSYTLYYIIGGVFLALIIFLLIRRNR